MRGLERGCAMSDVWDGMGYLVGLEVVCLMW